MKSIKLIWASIIIGMVCFGSAQAAGRVLVVHSYHQEYDWVQGINSGIGSIFNTKVPYRFFYMDTKRRPSKQWKAEAALKAKQVLSDYKPDVVIAVDDNAQAFFVQEYVGSGSYNFVFCGVNADPEQYNYPAQNVTGILERAYVKQVISMLKHIVPKARKLVWISDTSATSALVLPRVQAISKAHRLPIQIVEYFQPATFEHWSQTIRKVEKDPEIDALLIPLYHTVKNRIGGESILPSKVMQWTVENTTKPIVGFWPFSADDGALCAVVVDPYEHGKVAALMAKQIIDGKAVSDLPIMVNRDGYVIVNLKTADKLQIDIPFEVIQSADKIVQ